VAGTLYFSGQLKNMLTWKLCIYEVLLFLKTEMDGPPAYYTAMAAHQCLCKPLNRGTKFSLNRLVSLLKMN
jgi:hypothetical protein